MSKLDLEMWAAIRGDEFYLFRDNDTAFSFLGDGRGRVARVHIKEIDDEPCDVCRGEREDGDERCEGCSKALCPDCVKHDVEWVPLCPECLAGEDSEPIPEG